jgi:tetratricopeptide (TPR) repeat protein
MDASVLQRHEMQVSEENILRVADACEHALELQKKGDIEGSISLLRSGLRPPSLWRRHAIGAASWAAFESALAAAFCDRIVGSRAANIEAALGHFESALLVFTIEDYPTQFAECSNGLATAYTERIEGEKAHNLESAIQHFHSALSVYTLQSFPERWAMVNSNLGTAFMERDEGDRADNYEVAIEHYQNALEV